jgi:hypothetical protein
MEFIFEVVFEILFELIIELLAAVGLRKSPKSEAKASHPLIMFFVYPCFGALVGYASLWVFPQLFIKTYPLQLLGVIVTPVLVGLVMSLIGTWRKGRGTAVILLDSFPFAYVFALGVAVTRLYFAV